MEINTVNGIGSEIRMTRNIEKVKDKLDGWMPAGLLDTFQAASEIHDIFGRPCPHKLDIVCRGDCKMCVIHQVYADYGG